jgi:hypothetical protein
VEIDIMKLILLAMVGVPLVTTNGFALGQIHQYQPAPRYYQPPPPQYYQRAPRYIEPYAGATPMYPWGSAPQQPYYPAPQQDISPYFLNPRQMPMPQPQPRSHGPRFFYQ